MGDFRGRSDDKKTCLRIFLLVSCFKRSKFMNVPHLMFQVTCQSFYEAPPLMGMTLSSVSVLLSQGFRYHRLHLGFNTGHHNVSRNIFPECTVILDTVINILVYDWWHPKYPHFETTLRLNKGDEEQVPVLKNDFFTNEEM